MTRAEFIATYRHEIDGWILDAALANRSGAELSLFLRGMRSRIEEKLGDMYERLTAEQQDLTRAKLPAGKAR